MSYWALFFPLSFSLCIIEIMIISLHRVVVKIKWADGCKAQRKCLAYPPTLYDCFCCCLMGQWLLLLLIFLLLLLLAIRESWIICSRVVCIHVDQVPGLTTAIWISTCKMQSKHFKRKVKFVGSHPSTG